MLIKPIPSVHSASKHDKSWSATNELLSENRLFDLWAMRGGGGYALEGMCASA